MTLVGHGTMSAAIAYQVTHDASITVFAFFLGILNDIFRVVIREEDWTGTYLMLHKPAKYFSQCGRNPMDAWYIYTLWIIVPPIGLHALIDWYWHKPYGGWYWWGVPAEILLWIGFYFTGIPTEWYYGIVNLF